MPAGHALIDHLRPQARQAPESGIVEVMNYGRRRGDVVPLWVGESDIPTPAFIAEAATRALAAGETFYTWQRGIPELREALARYHARLYGRDFSPDSFYVTGSGMQAIQIAVKMVAGAGDEIVIPTPAWPNASAETAILGARPVEVPMTLGNAGWSLDFDRLAAAITRRTRALFIVSPSNPTGWTATHEELVRLRDLARRHGLWIVADETYARFWHGEGHRAPSFLDVVEPDERILFVNTFSKNWAMTGWRMGWLMAHPSLGQVIENLVQYSTSGVAQFMQRAGVAALDHGEGFIAHQVARVRRNRDIVGSILRATGRCRFAMPSGAFYFFFAVEGESETTALAKRLIDETGVGLAPGATFGAGGEGFLRLCVARDPQQTEDAVRRLAAAM
ncbi:MAG: pyridoxal phosphate-dependent aminotransferase [Pseudorhodoplanes sp.]